MSNYIETNNNDDGIDRQMGHRRMSARAAHLNADLVAGRQYRADYLQDGA